MGIQPGTMLKMGQKGTIGFGGHDCQRWMIVGSWLSARECRADSQTAAAWCGAAAGAGEVAGVAAVGINW